MDRRSDCRESNSRFPAGEAAVNRPVGWLMVTMTGPVTGSQDVETQVISRRRIFRAPTHQQHDRQIFHHLFHSVSSPRHPSADNQKYLKSQNDFLGNGFYLFLADCLKGK